MKKNMKAMKPNGGTALKMKTVRRCRFILLIKPA